MPQYLKDVLPWIIAFIVILGSWSAMPREVKVETPVVEVPDVTIREIQLPSKTVQNWEERRNYFRGVELAEVVVDDLLVITASPTESGKLIRFEGKTSGRHLMLACEAQGLFAEVGHNLKLFQGYKDKDIDGFSIRVLLPNTKIYYQSDDIRTSHYSSLYGGEYLGEDLKNLKFVGDDHLVVFTLETELQDGTSRTIAWGPAFRARDIKYAISQMDLSACGEVRYLGKPERAI